MYKKMHPTYLSNTNVKGQVDKISIGRVSLIVIMSTMFFLVAFDCANTKADLLFTEILQDAPDTLSESDAEWFEIFNSGPTAIDLIGYSITDASNNSVTINQSLVVQPGEYLLFARSSDENETGLLSPDYLFDFSLNNNGETLLLRDSSNNLLDEVTWGDATEGHSFFLSGTDPTVDNNDMSNWLTSSLIYYVGPQGIDQAFGTPGEVNDDGPLSFTTIPEPGSFAALAVCLVAMTGHRNRNRRSTSVFPF